MIVLRVHSILRTPLVKIVDENPPGVIEPGLELMRGLEGLNPPSSGLDPPSSGLAPPDLFVFVMYFVHEFGSTPLALR